MSSATPDAEPQLPRKVRRVLERATKDMTDAAQAAHSARELAEQAAAAHAERAAKAGAAATDAIQARAAAERVARNEAQRRTVAEQLASETAEQAAMANAAAQAALIARTEAEEAALRASLEREAAEANARAQAEAAARAEARAQDLAALLEEARAALLEQTRARLAAQEAQAAAPAPAADPPPPKPTGAPDERVQPEGVPELVEFRSPGSSAVVTVLLGIGALVAAGLAVREAYLDRLTTPPGIAAGAVTLLLVLLVGRSEGSAGRVWLERGVLHVDEGDSHRRFDLRSPDTKVEMVGRPGTRGWNVLLLRKGTAPYEIDSRLVDPEPFVAALEPWRPSLGQRSGRTCRPTSGSTTTS